MRDGSRLGGLGAAILCALLVAACGTGAAPTTSEEDVIAGDTAPGTATTAGQVATTRPDLTSTTIASSTTVAAGEGGKVSIDDIPPECMAVIRSLLAIIEPAVSDIDWESATINEFIIATNRMAGSSIGSTDGCAEAEVDLEATEEEGAALFMELAAAEAPGAVGYFQRMLEIQDEQGDLEAVGECQPDVETFEAIVAEGVPMLDLPLGKQIVVLGLMGSLGYCSLQTQGELFYRPEVQEFLAGVDLTAGLE